MRIWINVAPQESWVESIRMGVCGAPSNWLNRGPWNRVQEGDTILFYATKPIKGLIGCGRVLDKFEDQTPLWPQEITSGRVRWPLRIRLAMEFVLPEDRWHTARVAIGPSISVQRSLMPIQDSSGLSFIKKLKEATANSETKNR